MIEFKFPPDSFAPDNRAGILNPLSSVEVGRDGIRKRRTSDPTLVTYLGRIQRKNVERQLDASTVCQIALGRLLSSMTMHRHNLEALLLQKDLQSSSFKFSRVGLEWPRREENIKPVPFAVIIPNGETVFDMPNLGANLIEETEGAYGENTVLRQVSRATQELVVHILSGHKEERRAVRAAFELFLLAEPNDEETGRKQIVPEYYNRVCRINLRGMGDPPDSESRALANEFELLARFEAQVAVVQLVTLPGFIQPTRTTVTAGNALISGA